MKNVNKERRENEQRNLELSRDPKYRAQIKQIMENRSYLLKMIKK